MKKEEILARIKKSGVDEREEMIETHSYTYGLITVLGMVLFFGIWNLVHGVKSPELISIFGGFVSTTSLYKYKKFGTNKFLVSGVLGIISVSIATISFFLGV